MSLVVACGVRCVHRQASGSYAALERSRQSHVPHGELLAQSQGQGVEGVLAYGDTGQLEGRARPALRSPPDVAGRTGEDRRSGISREVTD